MKVNVHVRDKHYPVFCGNGSQKVRWLSDVALHRYEHFEATDPGLAKGMRYENGQLIDMDGIITDKLENDVHVYIGIEPLPSIYRSPTKSLRTEV